ncbi:MAG: TIGR03087 family PEP-CTERM/XrtA system glycosyltransferase [Burkholderiaceae bacterium]
MEPILYLVHRIPFPPNKGDKIRSYHLLRHLATRHRVHLGTFIDNPDDAVYLRELAEVCASHCAVTLDPRSAKVRSLTGFLSGEPLTMPYYRNAELHRWVQRTIAEHNISKAVVFSAAMAQYVERTSNLHVVLDMVDVDSAKWAQYAQRRSWPSSFVYRREGEKLLASERTAAAHAAATVFVTRSEAELFARLAPEFQGRLHVIENGVDVDYFAPRADRPSPYSSDEAAIVFTGAMDYWPNIDAVIWFAQEVLPIIKRHRTNARFYIVGMQPAEAVSRLAAETHVIVTGAVPDVRPYLQYAAAVVAPLRVARGIQNKVLEAMAMGKAVVVTAAAAGGVSATSGVDLETASDAEEFARKTLHVMHPVVGDAMGQRARAQIVERYCWQRNLSAFDALLQPQQSAASFERKAGHFVVGADDHR